MDYNRLIKRGHDYENIENYNYPFVLECYSTNLSNHLWTIKMY